MSISKVFMICDAYESGVGHGFGGNNKGNPYPTGTDDYEAYGYGYERGLENKREMEEEEKKKS